jgi:hypothetical protein
MGRQGNNLSDSLSRPLSGLVGIVDCMGARTRPNDTNPMLVYLDTSHSPRNRRPRLEIAFGVDSERWLHASVYDLKRRSFLMKDASVVRIL